MFDLVTVGNFAIDLVISSGIANPSPTLGGPPTYVSLAARQLGARVAVISKVGKDFSEKYVSWLKANNVDLSGLKLVKDASTTSFTLRYRNGKRKLQLRNQAPPILLGDIPASLASKAIHISPVANEISQEVVHKLRTLTSILSLDPQGFVRKFDKEGNMRLKKWKNSSILSEINIYKSTLGEMKMVTGIPDLRMSMKKIHEIGPKIVLATKGIRGSTLLFDEKFYNIPSCKPKVLKDYTGAGDTFIGAFLAEYVKGENTVWCACIGSAAASVKIESVGPTLLGGKEEIYRRARKIFQESLSSQKK
jgi:sugar/nucleoside kinase (ribokinase family)